MERWAGKVALITGASAGIGAATTLALANQGLVVVGVARRVDRIEELKNKVTGKGEIFALKCDVAVEDDIVKAFEWIKNKFGTIHVLVNNAGIIRPGALSSQDSKYWQEIWAVNVHGLCVCTKMALQLMKESNVDDGHIIHINSIAGHRVPFSNEVGLGVYPASKFAVTALTETLRNELRLLNTKTRVTSISPGYVATEIVGAGVAAVGIDSTKIEEMVAEQPALESEDIADAVVYVLSTPRRVQIHELTIKPVGELF